MPRGYIASDWYWKVGDGPADQVYASAVGAYVPEVNPDYLAFRADGNVATVIDTEANLRDVLEQWGVRFLSLPLRPIVEARPRVNRARLRLVRTGQSIASGTGALIGWTAAGAIDPLGMWNAGAPTAITIPEGQDGLYLATVSGTFPANGVGTRSLQMRRNGNPIPRATLRFAAAGVTDPTEFYGTRPIVLQGLDVFRVAASQDSGGPLLVDADVILLRIE